VEARFIDQAIAETALGRLGEPEDIAEAVAFLVSPAARHITGEICGWMEVRRHDRDTAVRDARGGRGLRALPADRGDSRSG
jgi:NAD(P)-dependent dehydrogenase (short-subunit alcohol dehydrogenase family)